MPSSRRTLLVCLPVAILVCLLSHLPVHVIGQADTDTEVNGDGLEIQFLDVDGNFRLGNPLINPFDEWQALVNHMNFDAFTAEDISVFLCQTHHGSVEACLDSPDYRTYLEDNHERMMAHTENETDTEAGATRRKRFVTYNTDTAWGGPSPSGWDWNSWNQPEEQWQFAWPTNPKDEDSSGSDKKPICPKYPDPSKKYMLSSSSDEYPTKDIADELRRDRDLRAFLFKEMVFGDDDEPKPPRPNATCPYRERRVWRYRSDRRRRQGEKKDRKCWILQNVGEPVLYRTCKKRLCVDCNDPKKDKGKKPKEWFTFGHSSGPKGDKDKDLDQKRCLASYRYVSFWAYCPGKSRGRRIIRDRIIVPICCNCHRVRCERGD